MEDTQKAEHAAKPQKSGDVFWKVTTVALIVILAVVAFRGNSGGAPTGGAVLPSLGGDDPTPSVIDMEALLDDDSIRGDKDAPVTIVEWSDFECPFCARFFEQTLPSIEEEYIKTGKVKLIYRDFPLSFHTNAQKAAEAAECAGEQGKYW